MYNVFDVYGFEVLDRDNLADTSLIDNTLEVSTAKVLHFFETPNIFTVLQKKCDFWQNRIDMFYLILSPNRDDLYGGWLVWSIR